jgi:RNA recognition motif-containing protein
MTEEELRNMFREYGDIKTLQMPKNAYGQNRGMAFIAMADEESAAMAEEKLNGHAEKGHKIRVEFSNPFFTGDAYERKMHSHRDEDDYIEYDDSDRTYVQSIRSLYGGFTSDTINSMFGSQNMCSEDGTATYRCVNCDKDFPRKRQARNGEQYITIDHRESVKRHWKRTKNTKLTTDQRGKWYNDPSNLQLMCNTCNSKKGAN